jgi:hypothetical protein
MRIQFVAISLFFMPLFISCGEDKEAASGEEKEESTELSEGEKLGQQMVDNYNTMMDDLQQLFKDCDTTITAQIELKEKMAALKEKHIWQFVEFGKARMELSSEEREKAKMKVQFSYSEMPEERFEFLNAFVQKSNDPQLENELGEFTMLTMYTDFELLKEQNPEEFKRLKLDEL